MITKCNIFVCQGILPVYRLITHEVSMRLERKEEWLCISYHERFQFFQLPSSRPGFVFIYAPEQITENSSPVHLCLMDSCYFDLQPTGNALQK